MKCFQIEQFGLKNLLPGHRESRPLKPQEVRVALKACALNFRDLMVITGQYNPKLKLPLIPCSDGAGVVTEVGAGVTEFAVADRVCATFSQAWPYGTASAQSLKNTLGSPLDGTLAEEQIFCEQGLIKFPKHLSFEEAATLPCAGLTAFNALFHQEALNPGDTVLIEGTGGVSLFALQFARLLGLNTVVISKCDDKLRKATELGASHVLNYRKHDDWHEQARAITDGRGVDMVIEVGGAGTLAKGIAALKRGGMSCLIGVLGGVSCDLDLRSILMHEIRVHGIFVGSRALFVAMNRVVEHAKLRPVIDRVFDFSEAPAAFAHLESAQHFGKICIKIA